MRPRIDGRQLLSVYLAAKRHVLTSGYEREIAWQEAACERPVTETRFLSEAAWVVLNSGMREAVVRKVFPRIAAAFAGFLSAQAAIESVRRGGREEALEVFRHPGKIDAIADVAMHVALRGIDEVRADLAREGVTFLRRFPYVGPVTALHLAKNLGHNVAKPDRHLVRISAACGYRDTQTLCERVHDLIGDPVPVVDLVFWRYATLSPDYLDELGRAARATSSSPVSPGLSRSQPMWEGRPALLAAAAAAVP